MNTQIGSPGRIAAAAAFALASVGLMLFLWTAFGGSVPLAPKAYTVTATFAETGQLVPNADVRISGIDVGKVAAIRAKGVDSVVTMTITPAYAPLPVNVRAILRLKTLLGEAYIDMSWGDRAGPRIPDGGSIPAAQVERTQALDQILNTFTQPVQHDLGSLLTGSARSLNGTGPGLNSAFGWLAQATGELAPVSGAVSAESVPLGHLIANAGTVLSAVGSRSHDVDSLVDGADSVLAATASENRALTESIREFPGFLASLRATVGTLNTTLGDASPVIRGLQPSAGLLKPALAETIALSGPTIRLLRQSPGLVSDAITAAPDITEFGRAFDPMVRKLLPVVENVIPMIELMADYRNELTASMANDGAAFNATGPADTTQAVGGVAAGTAHYARVVPPLNDEMIYGQGTVEPDDRHNAYPAPGDWLNWATGLLSSDCNNIHNTPDFGAAQTNVPCRVAPGFSFDGKTAYYPQLTMVMPRNG